MPTLVRLVSYGFSSSHVWMWELDYKESWAPKNWCFWTVVLEKTLGSPLDCKEIQPVHPTDYQFWIFIGRTDVEAETPVPWPQDEKNWLIGKDPDTGKDWGQAEKGWQRMRCWMASLTQWTWVWTSPGTWWWTGKPGVLQSMVLQRVGHNWVTELMELFYLSFSTSLGIPRGLIRRVDYSFQNFPDTDVWCSSRMFFFFSSVNTAQSHHPAWHWKANDNSFIYRCSLVSFCKINT